jgi:hypothetical protein
MLKKFVKKGSGLVADGLLVFCIFDSIHLASWLSQFENKRVNFLLFPSSPHKRVHSELERCFLVLRQQASD